MPSWSSLPPLARIAWLIGLALALVFAGASVWLFFSELKTGRRLRLRGRSLPAAFPIRRIAMITTPPLLWSELLRFSWPGELGGSELWWAISGGHILEIGLWAFGAVLLPTSIYFWIWGRASGFIEDEDAGEDPALLAEQFREIDPEDFGQEHLPIPTRYRPELLSPRAAAQDQRFRFYAHMARGGGGAPQLDLGELLQGSPGPEIPVDPKTGLLAAPPPAPTPEQQPLFGRFLVNTDEAGSLSNYAHLSTFGALLLLFDFWPGLLLGAALTIGYAAWSWFKQL